MTPKSKITREIFEHIQKTHELIESYPGLMSGYGGAVIFLVEYYKVTKDSEVLSLINSLVDKIVQMTFEGKITLINHSDGLTGVNWLLQYLRDEKFFDSEADGIIEQLNSIIGNWMLQELEVGNYDFLYGALGPLNCLINCRKQTRIIEDALHGIEGISIKNFPTGYKWTRQNEPEVVDFGLAHGMPSIISVVLRAYQNDIFPQLAKRIIIESCNYLVSQKGNFSDQGYYWPHTSKSNVKSRLAWCYGDLSIGYALYKSALTLGINTLEQDSLSILQNTSTRTNAKSNLVNDCCLCHGTIGLALMFQRLNLLKANLAFSQASNYWLSHSLAMITTKNIPIEERINTDVSNFGGAGSKDYNTVMNSALLSGVSGIGLSMIAMDSSSDSNWLNVIIL
jgi:lantibiotic modifying enzyme